jgi:hypothetical protein
VGLRAGLDRCGKSPRTVQSVASRYTDYAFPAHRYCSRRQNKQTTNRSTSQRAAALHWVQQTASYRTPYDPRKQTIHGPAESSGAVKIMFRYRTQSATHRYNAAHRTADTARLHEFRLLMIAINRTGTALRDEWGIPRTVSGKYVYLYVGL